MKNNYTINYLKNSVFQILSTAIGMLSLFVVVPFLSENKVLYGIYSVCISLNIFFSYADFGFLSAGQKYAGEFFAQGKLQKEIEIVGFISFAFLVFVTLIGLCLLPFAIKPELLISELDASSRLVASRLIFVLILSAPFVAIKRVCMICFSCRIEQYKYQCITLVGHVIKILSVLYFFRDGNYQLLEYYIFIQLVDIICTILLVGYVVVKYDYNIKMFCSSFRFNKSLWSLVKGLVGASLFSTVSWILYYELDLIVLAKISRPETLAIYSAAFTLLSFSRNYFAVIYSSFSARYNHYVGLKDFVGLKRFFENNTILLFPFAFFPIVLFLVSGTPLVLSWVGPSYEDSAIVAKILFSGSLLAFISYPSGQYLYAVNKLNGIYISSLIMPILFWGGIVLTYSYWGVFAFAIFKTASQLISSAYSYIISIREMKISVYSTICKLIKQYWLPTILTFILGIFVIQFMRSTKTLDSIIINICLLGGVYVAILMASIINSGQFRQYSLSVINKIRH